jgi:hypothetical protein
LKSPFAFITRPLKGNRYNNTKEVGGIDLIVNTSQEDHKYSNREAEVIELPIGYKGPIKIGNILLVHHNVFKYYNDIQGNQKSGKSWFKDDLFFVESEQFFMYKNENGWNAYGKNCFIRPASVEDSYLYKNIAHEPLVGIVVYPNAYMISEGVIKGSKVSFKPESEYEFNVDGEVLYRILDHQITMTL